MSNESWPSSPNDDKEKLNQVPINPAAGVPDAGSEAEEEPNNSDNAIVSHSEHGPSDYKKPDSASIMADLNKIFKDNNGGHNGAHESGGGHH